MAWDDHKNLAYSRVTSPPSPAISGTSLTIGTGEGVLFPAVPFNCTIWPNGQNPTASNAEIIRVTNVAGDVFTITRAQEGTASVAIGNNYQIANTITAKVITDIETVISNMISAGSGGGVTLDQVSARAEVASAAATSVDARVTSANAAHDVLSLSVAVVSAAAAAADAHASIASIAATSADNHANTVSVAAAAADAHASVASIAATSVNARVTSLEGALGSISCASGAGSINGLQSVINALSQRISSLTGGGVTTATISAVVDIASNVASAGNASLDAKISVVSDRVTSISAQLTSLEVHASAASAAATSVDARVNTVSNLVSALTSAHNGLSNLHSALSDKVVSISAQLTSLEVHASAASAAATSVDTRVNTVSNLVSALTSAHNALSNVVSGLSPAAANIHLLSLQNVDASAISAGTPVYAFTSANTIKKANASIAGTELVIGLVADASIGISAIGRVQTMGALSLTSVQWGDVTSATTSGLVTGAIYFLGSATGMLTSVEPTGSAVVHVVGQAISPNVMQLMLTPFDDQTSAFSAISGAVTSVDGRATSLAAAISNLTSAHNALSNTVSAGGGGGANSAYVLSQINLASAQAASALADAISAGSATASNLLSHIDAVSAVIANVSTVSAAGVAIGLQSVINALSNRISAAAGGGQTADQVSARAETASAAATSIGTLLSTLSDRVTSISAQLTSLEVHASAASAAATSVDARVNTVSNLVSALTSAHNGLSNLHSALSDKVVSISAQLTSLEVHASAASAAATSVDARVASLSVFFASLSVRSAGVSTHGLQSILNTFSNRISAAGGGDVASVDAKASIISDRVTSISAQLVSLETRISNISIDLAALSVFAGTVDTKASAAISDLGSVKNFLSAISAVKANASVVLGLQSIVDALSDRISVVSAAGAAGGATTAFVSALVDAASAQAASALADAISAGSATASNLLSHIEALSVAIQAVSTVSGAGTAVGLQSVVNAISVRMADNNSALVNASTVGSIAALSLAIANDASVSAAIKTDIASVSVVIKADITSVSAAVMAAVSNSLSLQYGLGQVRAMTAGTAAVSATNFAKISGLSISLAANAWYHVQGRVMHTTSIVTGTMFGFVYPGTNNMTGDSYMRMACLATVMAAGPAGSIYTSAIYPTGNITGGNMSTVVCTNLSMTGASANIQMLEIDGMVNTGSAGVIELNMKQSATGGGVFVRPGSYLRAYKVT